MLSKSCEEKKVEEKSITELLVDNLSKLTEKIEKISVNQCDSSKVKSQVVARRNCPSWTAGTSLEVYKRWVNDWNDNDKSDALVKYIEITKSLSENKVIYGLKDYMKKIVIPSLSATGEENVKSILEKLDEKYQKNKFEKYESFIDMLESFSVQEKQNQQDVWEKFLQMMEKSKSLK